MKITAITETYLSSHIYENEILPPHFNIYRKDGGTCSGWRNYAGVDQSKTIPNPEDIEVISGQLLTQHPVMIRHVYNPPNSEGIYQHKLISFLRDVIQSNNEVIILGNFNVPDID